MSESVWKILKENKLQLNNEISSDLKCKICKQLMIKASSAPCGCRFCSDCIKLYLGGKEKFCPGTSKHCQRKMINYANDIAIDNAINIRISEIIVKCTIKNCEFKDELGMIENHMRTCDKRPITCPFHEIGCEKNEVLKEEMKDHFNDESYCHNKLLIDLINNFRNEIESMGNKMESLSNDIIELKTENSQLKLQFDNIDFQSTNRQEILCEMKSKEKRNSTETDIINTNISLRKDIESNIKSINEVKQTIQLIQTKSQQIDDLNKNYEQLQQKQNNEIEMLKKDHAKFCGENTYVPKLKDYDKTSKLIIDGKINNLESKMIEIESNLGNENFGKLNWRIERLSQQRGCRIYSKPFFSEQSGYKMCLSMQIRFDSCYIYFHLMRGIFDNIFTWPFQYVVKIDVIDQENGNVYQNKVIKYSDWPDHAGWGKPLNDRNDGIWFNDIDIEIDSPAVKNDQVLIKCRVEKEK